MTTKGHNRKAAVLAAVEEIEDLNEQKADLGSRQKEIKADLKEQFEITPREVNEIIRRRKWDAESRQEFRDGVEQLELDLGMIVKKSENAEAEDDADPEDAAIAEAANG